MHGLIAQGEFYSRVLDIPCIYVTGREQGSRDRQDGKVLVEGVRLIPGEAEIQAVFEKTPVCTQLDGFSLLRLQGPEGAGRIEHQLTGRILRILYEGKIGRYGISYLRIRAPDLTITDERRQLQQLRKDHRQPRGRIEKRLIRGKCQVG